MLVKPEHTVYEMWIGELIFGLICQIGVIFFKTIAGGYSIGLWLGVLCAMAASYHMWWTIQAAMRMDGKKAGLMGGSSYLIRYLVVIALLLVLHYSGFGNPFTAFLGYMSLKGGAYLYPLVRLVTKRWFPDTVYEETENEG